ncbi:MAG: hypothetical protein AAF196_13620 [Planctomycetota bacterium]
MSGASNRREPKGSAATLNYLEGDAHLLEAFESLRPDREEFARRLRQRIQDHGDPSPDSIGAPEPDGSANGRFLGDSGNLFRTAFRRAATWLPPVLLPASLARAAGVGAAAAAKTKGAKAALAWVLGLPGLVLLLIVALGVVGLRSTRRFETDRLERVQDRPSRLARLRKREIERHGWIPFVAGIFPFVAAMNLPDIAPSWSMPVVLALGIALLFWRRHATGCAEREILASDIQRVFGTFAMTEVLLAAFSPGLADPIHAGAALLAYTLVGATPSIGSPLREALDPLAGPLVRTACGIWLLAAPHLSGDAFGVRWPGLLFAMLGILLAVGLRGVGYVLTRTKRFGVGAGVVQIALFSIATWIAIDQVGRSAEREADRWLSAQMRDIEVESDPRLNEWTYAYEAAERLGILEDERDALRDTSYRKCSALTRYLHGWDNREQAYARAVEEGRGWANDFAKRLLDPVTDSVSQTELINSAAGLGTWSKTGSEDSAQLHRLWFLYRLLGRSDPEFATRTAHPFVEQVIRENYEPSRNTFALRNRFDTPSYNLSIAILIRDLHDDGLDVSEAIDLHRFRRSLRSWKGEPENRVAARLLDGVGPNRPSGRALWAWWLPAGLILLVAGFGAAVAHRAPSILSSDPDDLI